jgi:hypothetical protein
MDRNITELVRYLVSVTPESYELERDYFLVKDAIMAFHGRIRVGEPLNYGSIEVYKHSSGLLGRRLVFQQARGAKLKRLSGISSTYHVQDSWRGPDLKKTQFQLLAVDHLEGLRIGSLEYVANQTRLFQVEHGLAEKIFYDL